MRHALGFFSASDYTSHPPLLSLKTHPRPNHGLHGPPIASAYSLPHVCLQPDGRRYWSTASAGPAVTVHLRRRGESGLDGRRRESRLSCSDGDCDYELERMRQKSGNRPAPICSHLPICTFYRAQYIVRPLPSPQLAGVRGNAAHSSFPRGVARSRGNLSTQDALGGAHVLRWSAS